MIAALCWHYLMCIDRALPQEAEGATLGVRKYISGAESHVCVGRTTFITVLSTFAGENVVLVASWPAVVGQPQPSLMQRIEAVA